MIKFGYILHTLPESLGIDVSNIFSDERASSDIPNGEAWSSESHVRENL